MKEYKAYVYQESLLGSLFFGQSKIDPEKLTKALNEQAALGYRVVSLEKETRRMMLFWSREAFLIILERDKRPSAPGAH